VSFGDGPLSCVINRISNRPTGFSSGSLTLDHMMQNAQMRAPHAPSADAHQSEKDVVATHTVPEPDGHGLHPESRMSNDFLNHYNELVMLLEMLPGMPDCLEDVTAWAPKSYVAHFRDSGLHWSDYAIAEYELLDAEWKGPFEHILAILDEFLVDSIALLKTVAGNDHFERDPTISLMMVATAQGLLGQLNHIIAGGHITSSDLADPFEVDDAQALADELF
jgi:hypothetical protein